MWCVGGLRSRNTLSSSHFNDFFFCRVFVLLAPLCSPFAATLAVSVSVSVPYVWVPSLSGRSKHSWQSRENDKERKKNKTTWVTAERINWCAIRRMFTYTSSRSICEFIIRKRIQLFLKPTIILNYFLLVFVDKIDWNITNSWFPIAKSNLLKGTYVRPVFFRDLFLVFFFSCLTGWRVVRSYNSIFLRYTFFFGKKRV